MVVTRKLEAGDINIQIECQPELIPVTGHAMASGDPEVDKAAENDILSQLADGNDWAWGAVTVSGTFHGLSASDHLGCCSYKDEQDFRKDGYFDDMVSEVVADLNRQVSELVQAVLR